MNPAEAGTERNHPIHYANVEILGEIFVHCLAGIPPNGHPDDLDENPISHPECWVSETQITLRQKQPFILAAVCSSWRAACLATPRVWQNLDVSLNGPALIRAGAAARMIYDVLRYSGATPLGVRLFHWLFSTGRDRRWDDPEVNLLVVASQAAMARCGALVVSGHVSGDLRFDPLGRILRVNTPKLRTASLCGDFWVGTSGARLSHPSDACILPDFDRLRSLEVDGSFLLGLKDIAGCVNLQTAKLRLNAWDDENRDLAFRFLASAPRLTTVIVESPLEGSTMHHPLRATGCEAVRRLVLSVDFDTIIRPWMDEDSEPNLSAVFQLSFPRLEVVELRSCAKLADKCAALLRHLVSPDHTTEVVLHPMCSTIAFLPALEQARKLRRLTLIGLIFDNQEQIADWCDIFREQVKIHGARWQQDLEELYLYGVVFNMPWNPVDFARSISSTKETILPVFPRLRRFEVVEHGASTSHNIISAVENLQSSAYSDM